jgi:hypothetical protein
MLCRITSRGDFVIVLRVDLTGCQAQHQVVLSRKDELP